MTCKDCLHFRVCNAFGLITESYYEKTCAEFENRDDIFDKQMPKKPDFEGDGYDDSGFQSKTDFVELVRCRECIHWKASSHKDLYYCEYFDWGITEDDFCSYGERRAIT